MSSRIVSLLLCLAALAGMAQPAQAKDRNYRALLVGVSDYPALKKDLWLDGPRNDVARMREVLVARGVPAQNITVLADGVQGAGLPTRQAILDALDRLARTATPDDYIVIQMAGHGSQQPVPANSPHAAEETDGLFEIFLPRDVEAWGNGAPDSEGEVKNAIVDFELRERIDRMTATGAFVWAIFDSCHSATLVRGAGNPEVKLREVTPRELGISQSAIDRSVARATTSAKSAPAAPQVRRQVGPGEGGSVFFYAAQTFEPTPEMRLPAGAPERRSHGLFSFTIMQALEGGAGMTFQQLSQQVLTRYAGISEARATPLFSGTALQSGVFGLPTSTVRQWPVSGDAQLTVAAGNLAGVEDGAVFALLPAALSPDNEAVGYARVVRASMASSVLAPAEFNGKPARPVADLQPAKVARLVQPALKFEFLVSTDLSACASPCPFGPAIAALKAPDGVPNVQVRWVDAKETANVKLVADGRRLWFAAPSAVAAGFCTGEKAGQGRCGDERSTVYVDAAATASTAGLVAELQPALHAASRAANLMRVATALSGTAAASQLAMSLRRVSAAGAETPITGADLPRLVPGDKVRVGFENTGRSALDVTVLYLDSKYGVAVMFPEPGASNRLEAGAKLAPFDIDINDSTIGMERLAVIAVEARRGAERADYSFLAQPTMRNATVTRSVGDGSQLFRDAGFAEFKTRGATAAPAAPPSNTGMQVFSWQIVPR